MTNHSKSIEELERDNESLLSRLEELTNVLTAIRTGSVDALVVESLSGEQVFTLEGADHPYRVFVETMNEGAVTLAIDGTIVYCNRQFADLVGTILEQTFGRMFLDFVVPSDRPEFIALMAQQSGVSIHAELSLEQPYGMTIPVRLSARRLPQNVGNFWCLVVTDLRGQRLHDAMRENEERLRAFTGKLEQRVEERTSELVVSQERLRALAIELNRTEQRERKRMAEELHDHLAQLLALSLMKLAQIKQSGATSARNELVNKVQELLVEGLNYTRTLVTDLSPTMLHDFGLLRTLNWLAEKMQQRHQHTVHIEIPQGDDDLKLSEEQALVLFQSIRELLINTIKHSGAHEATLALDQRDGTLRIDVRDRGKGFDVYTKVRANNSTHFGLFSISERMQAIGGSLELQSTIDRGTRATLILPLDKAPATSPTVNPQDSMLSASAPIAQPSANLKPGYANVTSALMMKQTIRVLLVDDHAMVRQGLRTVLDGYADIQIVGEASNGEEALVCVATHRPNIVVMDINMPKMNGVEATTAIASRYPEIIVIGLSVQSGGEIQQAMLKAGAAVLLNKEAAVEQLYQTIQSVHKGSEPTETLPRKPALKHRSLDDTLHRQSQHPPASQSDSLLT